MSEVKAIKTNKDYESALQRLEKIFDAKPGSKDSNEAEVLVILIQDYEKRNFPIEPPSPIEAIKFRMEQMNLKQADLAPLLGSKSRVSEILNGKRSLTVEMITALHKELEIPLESLLNNSISKSKYLSSGGNKLPMASEKKHNTLKRTGPNSNSFKLTS